MLKVLIKKQLMQMANMYLYDRRKGRMRSKAGIILFIGLYIFLFICCAFAFFGIAMLMSQFVELGLTWLYFAMMGMISVFISSIIDMFMASSILFKARDNDLLLAMPIKPSYILISRMTSLYVWGLVFELMTFAPAMLVYWIQYGFTPGSVICPLLVFVLNSLIILSISCLLGWVVAFITSKIRNKTVGTVITTLLLLGFYYVIYFRLNTMLSEAVTNAVLIGETVSTYIFPMYAMGMAGAGDPLMLLVHALIAIGIFAVTCLLLSRSFIKIATENKSAKGKEYKRAELKEASTKNAMIRKELRHFIGSPAYMLNMGLGIILLPVLGILTTINAEEVKMTLFMFLEMMGKEHNLVLFLIFAASGLTMSMGCFTAPSISLEGKNLWILRTSPVSAYDVLSAKINTQVYLNAPSVLIFTVLCVFAFGLGPEELMLLAVFSIVYLEFLAQIGLFINLHKPRFDWTTETEPIKQGASVAIVLFGDWALLVVILVGVYFLSKFFSTGQMLIGLIIIFAVLVRILDKWMRTKGAAMFDEL